MKRPLTTDDYIAITYDSVRERYPVDSEHHDLYATLCAQGWQSFKMNGFPAPDRMIAYKRHMLFQVYEVEYEKGKHPIRQPLAHMIRDEPKTYRVSLNSKGGVEVVCFDLENIDSELEGYYDAIADLPIWVQERVAVLAVCNPEPPTHIVEGIGRRISENIYWVYK